MDELENETGNQGIGAIWRLRRSDAQGLESLEGTIVVELADRHGTILASVSIPSETIDELLQPHVSIFAELQLDGSVSLDSEFFASFPTSKKTDIYRLVREGIAPEMLRDEPKLKEQLSELRHKLTEAISLVDDTLANLDKPSA